jgi:integrase
MDKHADGSGTVAWHKGRWHARVSMKDKAGKTHRPWIDLERPSIPNTPEGRELARKELPRILKGLKSYEHPGDNQPVKAPAQTIADLVERWFELLDRDPGKRAPSTVYDYKSRMRANVVPALGQCVPPLTIPQLRSFFRDLKARKSTSTTRNTSNALTAFCDDAKAEGWIAGPNPMRDREVRDVLPQQEAPDPEDIVQFTREQVLTLLASPKLPEDRRGLYIVAVTSGMRDGELRGILRSRVDLDGEIPTVDVRQQLRYPRGKKIPATLGKLKSKHCRRTLPLHPAAVAWLKAHRKDIAADAFVLGDGTRPDGAEIIRADLEAAGLPTTFKLPTTGEVVDFTMHAFRRTFATLLEAAEVPGELVDRMLGQAPASTRAKHYAKTDLARWYRAILQIDLDNPGGREVDPRTPQDNGNPPGCPGGCPSDPVTKGAQTEKALKTDCCHPSSVVEQRFRKSIPGVTSGNHVSDTIDGKEPTSRSERVASVNDDVARDDARTPRSDPPGQPAGTTGQPLSQNQDNRGSPAIRSGLRAALEVAIAEAHRAQAWGLVATLAAQLDALPPENVVDLASRKAKG